MECKFLDTVKMILLGIIRWFYLLNKFVLFAI